MNTKSVFLSLILSCLLIWSCSDKTKKLNNEDVKSGVLQMAEIQTVSFAVSGMTCEIGCAKTIQSKLSKKEGITDAIVVFSDSTATVSFDSSKTSSTDISSFISGIAGGDAYTASELKPKKSL
ncbi:cation transporter [Flavobacteriaceae bacterium]|jgi:periplasmic mercuric ion binding protein|nr:cation transporter [Flavobacteriaceae bacterium]MDB2418106.1 cation transporter [Flavobacteriaceae bacterium]MDB2624894.1 cation transporter [Flavobacteriaceae bacterium]MDB2658203.1 cation transporter [Flavobacteriaceae bacterium]MDG1980642.1 heavy metal-associated domain-containing protein [Flavobacteriaceae bacterium]|tara:strand:- start:5188 stop:5556 length:369 start_codon:yes stop_codon:yes gene_type:complete